MTENPELILTKSDRILKLLADVSDLPAIPKVLVEVSQLFDMPDASIKKLSSVIGKDQTLTLKVLSVANSPLYGLRKNVASIDTAILILGFHELKSIVTSLKLMSAVKIKSDKYFDSKNFWLHSMVVGTLSQRMSRDLNFNFEGDCFVAGILHDMGIFVIHQYLADEYYKIIDYAQLNNTPLFEAEYKILGLTHEEIGKFLAEKWSLPSVLSDALQFHHHPAESKENNYLTSILHLADYATSKFQIASQPFDNDYKLDGSVIEVLNFLSPEELEDFIDAYREDITEAAHSQSI